MTIDIRVTRTLACSAETAFAVLSDFERNPEWQGGMVACRWRTDPPHGEGSFYEQEARFLGRAITTVFEVVDWSPGESVTIESRESTFPIRVTRAVCADGPERCTVKAQVTGDPTGIFKLAGPLMRRMVRRSVEKDYRTLAAMLGG